MFLGRLCIHVAPGTVWVPLHIVLPLADLGDLTRITYCVYWSGFPRWQAAQSVTGLELASVISQVSVLRPSEPVSPSLQIWHSVTQGMVDPRCQQNVLDCTEMCFFIFLFIFMGQGEGERWNRSEAWVGERHHSYSSRPKSYITFFKKSDLLLAKDWGIVMVICA